MNEQESLFAAIHEKVALADHDSSWANVFVVEKNRLLSLFPDAFSDIQHIGSTEVPGLPAKPIIDILAAVRSVAVAESLRPCCIAAESFG